MTTLPIAWLIGAATALGVAAACAWIGACLSRTGAPGFLADHPSAWLRLWGRLVSASGEAASAWLSLRRRRSIERRLARAGLRHAMEAIHYHGAQCLAIVVLACLPTLAWFAAMPASSPRSLATVAITGAALGALWPAWWLRDKLRERNRRIVRALPFMLDMTTLCVEAGLNLAAALQQAAQKGPAGPLRDELQRLQGDIRTGMARAQALRDLADRLDEPAVRSLVSTLVQADTLGMNLAPILRAQSDQRRTERFLHAEKLAMEAPVKMLLPLIAFIFPCTFIVIAFPIAVKLLELSS